jgi:hypothetical protein
MRTPSWAASPPQPLLRPSALLVATPHLQERLALERAGKLPLPTAKNTEGEEDGREGASSSAAAPEPAIQITHFIPPGEGALGTRRGGKGVKGMRGRGRERGRGVCEGGRGYCVSVVGRWVGGGARGWENVWEMS